MGPLGASGVISGSTVASGVASRVASGVVSSVTSGVTSMMGSSGVGTAVAGSTGGKTDVGSSSMRMLSSVTVPVLFCPVLKITIPAGSGVGAV